MPARNWILPCTCTSTRIRHSPMALIGLTCDAAIAPAATGAGVPDSLLGSRPYRALWTLVNVPARDYLMSFPRGRCKHLKGQVQYCSWGVLMKQGEPGARSAYGAILRRQT